MEHDSINRREFPDVAGKYQWRGLVAAGIGESLQPNSAARQAPTEQTGSLVSNISAFVVNTRFDAIPPKALETAKMAILDSLGVAVAGGTEESAGVFPS